MSGNSQPLPERKAVRKAVAKAEGKLLNVRASDAHNAALVRRLKKAIADLDGAHEAYCAKLEKRAARRASKLQRECDAREHVAEQLVAEARAGAQKGDPGLATMLQANAELFVKTVRTQNDTNRRAHSALKATDDALRRWGDGFVVEALGAASSKDGGRAFLKKLSTGADVAIAGGAPFPPTAPISAIAGIVKMIGTFLVKKFDKGPKAASDERNETAIVSLRAGTRLMRAWTAALGST